MSALPACVIVFGASGFLGRNLIDALHGRVETLIAVTHRTGAVEGCDRTVTIDRLDDLSALPGDTVAVHLAAARYDASRFALAQSDILAQNSTLNARIFHFCASRGIRELRLMSSVAVYPADWPLLDDDRPLDLNAPPHEGEAFYAWSKRQAEVAAGLYAARYGLSTIIFRLANPYGPHDSLDIDRAHVAPAFVMKALSAAPTFEIRGDPRVERDFIHVGDVVDTLVASLAWRGQRATYNLCTGESVSLRALAETVLRSAEKDKRIVAGAPGPFGPVARPSPAAKIKAATGLRFRSLEEGLRPTIAWYRHALRL